MDQTLVWWDMGVKSLKINTWKLTYIILEKGILIGNCAKRQKKLNPNTVL